MDIEKLKENEKNPRKIREKKFDDLVRSVVTFPEMMKLRPIVVDADNIVLGGNMRLRALKHIKSNPIQVDQLIDDVADDERKEYLRKYWDDFLTTGNVQAVKDEELTEEQKREFIIRDNASFGEWDWDILANEWDNGDLASWGVDVWEPVEFDGAAEDSAGSGNENSGKRSIKERFISLPISVFRSATGYWQHRKKVWKNYIGEVTGESREGVMGRSKELCYSKLYIRFGKEKSSLPQGVTFGEYLEKYVPEKELAKYENNVEAQNVSLFDPATAELCCQWFTPYKGARIIDPFAGDYVKGIVFETCGYDFTGIELRQEQVDVNNKKIKEKGCENIRYVCADGRDIEKYVERESADMVFSCPPYYDLEVYSDDPRDASNQGDYNKFLNILEEALTAACRCLKQDRFAVIVASDVRDKKTGFYHRMCDDVCGIMERAGLGLLNEIIYEEVVASKTITMSFFMKHRKVSRIHQKILVFYKGDPKEIKNKYPEIDLSETDILELIAKSGLGIEEDEPRES